MAQKIIIRDPYLNALTYDICYNLSKEDTAKLPLKYRKILKSEVKTKAFCDKSSMDERLIFLAAVGLNFAVTLMPDVAKNNTDLKNIFKKYEEQRSSGALKDLSKLRVFVSTDKNISLFSGMMADTIHTKSYLLNMDYNKTGNLLKDWSKRLETPSQKETLDTIANFDYLVKFIFNSWVAFDNVETFFGISDMDFKILLYLSQYRHTYLSKENIVETIYIIDGNKKKISSSLKRLLVNEYIRTHVDYRTPRYTITTLGIQKIHDLLQNIFKANNF